MSIILLIPFTHSLSATISPNPPNPITLQEETNYQQTKTYTVINASNDITAYGWNILETNQQDQGPEAIFTYTRENPKRNTVRLTYTNGTHAETKDITQILHDTPNTTITASDTTPQVNQQITLTASTTNTYDNPVTHSWSHTNQTTPTIQYTPSSTQTITHTATDQAGKTSQTQLTISPQDNSQNEDSGGGSSGGGGGSFRVVQEETSEETANDSNASNQDSSQVPIQTNVSNEYDSNRTEPSNSTKTTIDSLPITINTYNTTNSTYTEIKIHNTEKVTLRLPSHLNTSTITGQYDVLTTSPFIIQITNRNVTLYANQPVSVEDWSIVQFPTTKNEAPTNITFEPATPPVKEIYIIVSIGILILGGLGIYKYRKQQKAE